MKIVTLSLFLFVFGVPVSMHAQPDIHSECVKMTLTKRPCVAKNDFNISVLLQYKNKTIRLHCIIDDITKVKADVIVNSAREDLTSYRGTCRDIFNVAGSEDLQKALSYYRGCNPGDAIVTDSFALIKNGIKHIIHAVGPENLEDPFDGTKVMFAYKKCFILAEQLQAHSLAIPLISVENKFITNSGPLQTYDFFKMIEQFLMQHREDTLRFKDYRGNEIPYIIDSLHYAFLSVLKDITYLRDIYLVIPRLLFEETLDERYYRSYKDFEEGEQTEIEFDLELYPSRL